LSDQEGIAQELADSQRSISVAEFFEKNKHMLGFDSKARSIITATKEGVDNALDATEEAGIRPDIHIEIQESGKYYTLIMEDNGPGIPRDNISKVFGKLLYGSRFGSMTQSRGQQGIGISAAVLYSQITSGKPATLTSLPKGSEQAHRVELTLDTDTNEPTIHSEEQVDWEKAHGTRIELEMEANMRARSQLYDYIRSTAVVNPHAKITFIEPDLTEPLVFERGTEEMPQKPEEIQPHPHGVELGHVIKMLDDTKSNTLSGFLKEEFTRVGTKTAQNILDRFRDEWYGREMSFDSRLLPETRDETAPPLEARVIETVNNKSADSKAEFASLIQEAIAEEPRVSDGDVVRIVDQAADTVQDSFSNTYGETIRTNVSETVQTALRTVHHAQVLALLEEVTTVRKSDEAVATAAELIASQLGADSDYRATHAEVVAAVESGTDEAADQHGATFGDTSMGKMTDALWEVMHTVPDDVPLVREAAEDRDVVSALITGMKETRVSRPSTKCLSPITTENVEAGLRKEYDAEFFSASQRDAGVHSGHPFIVEAGLAYGGDIEAEGSIELLRFANRVPLVYQPGACGITQTIEGINWRNYKLSQSGGTGMPDGPVVLMIHVGSTNVPFTSESKDALASVPDIEHEVEQAVRAAARDLKKHLKKQKSRKKRQRKQNVIADILPTMADKLAETAETEPPAHEGSLSRVMNNMHVTSSTTNGTTTVTMENHTGGQKTFSVISTVDTEPSTDDDAVDIAETEEGSWTVRWRGPVRKNGTEQFSYDVAGSATHDVHVEELPAQKLTLEGS
jgi:DNA topoisomerase-6 subunit B